MSFIALVGKGNKNKLPFSLFLLTLPPKKIPWDALRNLLTVEFWQL